MGLKDIDSFTVVEKKGQTATTFGGIVTCTIPFFVAGYLAFLLWYNTLHVQPQTATEARITAGTAFPAVLTCHVERCAVTAGYGPQPSSAQCTALGAGSACRLLNYGESITLGACYSDDPIDGIKLMAWDKVQGSNFQIPEDPRGYRWGNFFQMSIRSWDSTLSPLHQGIHLLNLAATLYNTDPWQPTKNKTASLAYYPTFQGTGSALNLPNFCEGVHMVNTFGSTFGEYHLRLAPFYTYIEVFRPSIYITVVTQIGGFLSVLTACAALLVSLYQKAAGVHKKDPEEDPAVANKPSRLARFIADEAVADASYSYDTDTRL